MTRSLDSLSHAIDGGEGRLNIQSTLICRFGAVEIIVFGLLALLIFAQRPALYESTLYIYFRESKFPDVFLGAVLSGLIAGPPRAV